MSEQVFLLAPHGGRLIECGVSVAQVPSIWQGLHHTQVIDALSQADLAMFANGAYSPLDGFMDAHSRSCVQDTLHLPSGWAWTIPITLPVSAELARTLRLGQRLGLTDAQGTPQAVVDVREIYQRDASDEAQEVFGTTDTKHYTFQFNGSDASVPLLPVGATTLQMATYYSLPNGGSAPSYQYVRVDGKFWIP